MKRIEKWGFGMAPISEQMQARYDAAVQTMLDLINGNLTFSEVNLDSISELKGMFNRCIRQDQWDWFSVFTELGTPPFHDMKNIVSALIDLRRDVKEQNTSGFEHAKNILIDNNLLRYLAEYQSDLSDHISEATAGWVYILSTREQPEILKIGMTHRSVAQRVKEINSATGVLIPFAARHVFRVKDAARAEKEIFELLAEYRLRSDREFFKLSFSKATSIIQQYLATTKMKYRQNGIVLWYDKQKQYGFISVEGSEDIFLHSSQIQKNNLSQITQGTKVEFDLGKRPQGLCALNLSIAVQNSS